MVLLHSPSRRTGHDSSFLSRSLPVLAALTLCVAPARAFQDEDPAVRSDQEDPVDDREIVITPNRSESDALTTPVSVEVVSEQRLRERAYRTLPQALRDMPGVMIQKTGPGQGSPYIRGFTGFQNLVLIDGIRLNNSVFRAGPNQYTSTIDPFTVDRIELVKGPSAVLWGSDAVGGTVNVLTRDPYAWDDGFGGALELRFADQANYLIGRAEGSWTNREDTGVLFGYTGRDFGDLHGGSDVGLQPNTAYDEHSLDLKVEHWIDGDTRLVLGVQNVNQKDVPRTHSTVFGTTWHGLSTGSDLVRDLTQQRTLTYAQLHADVDWGWADQSTTSVSWHRQSEDRFRRRSSMAEETQGFDVGTLGLFQHFNKETSGGSRWTWGADVYHDTVDSYLDRGAAQTAADDIQGPVGDDATYTLMGLFVQDVVPISERLSMTFGARWSYADANADSVRDPVTDMQIAVDDSWSSATGSARFAYELEKDRRTLFGGISQGFRAPNLSDVTRFDTARSNEFEIPALGLDEERFLAFELGVRERTARMSAQAAAFYTQIEDGIVRVPTGNVNGAGDAEITKANVGDGYALGVELSADYLVADAWTVFGSFTWMDGKQDTYPTAAPVAVSEPLDRLMPIHLFAGTRFEPQDDDYWIELSARHMDDADDLSTRDRNDVSRIPPGGTPNFTTLDLRGGYDFGDGLLATFGLENLTDEDYRIHGSGVNAAGRNLVFGLRWSF